MRPIDVKANTCIDFDNDTDPILKLAIMQEYKNMKTIYKPNWWKEIFFNKKSKYWLWAYMWHISDLNVEETVGTF